MPNLNNFYGGSSRLSPVDAEDRAIAAWKRINDRPSSIIIYRSSSPMTAQTVRIEYDDKPEQSTETSPAESSERQLTIFGVKGHPTVADTSLVVGDRVTYNGHDYRINDVIELPGEIQASAERQT